ncbi:hypothetical protein HD554DRAFT_2167211 [Boletus coccyginus]|nr:hypothetical protein HD554DRAFT_2167211 [Boletus coccyginus]
MPRRAKPRVELAPDQPLTTHGNPRARVFVACLQCRTRKIRCDGAKPTCHNCTRRTNPTDPCEYDPAPRRRGPDKTPGARQRMPREALEETRPDAVAPHRRRRRSRTSLSQPSLVLDPQLADMPPFYSTPAASTPPLPPGSSLPGSGLPVPDGTLYHVTTSQGLHKTLTLPTSIPQLSLPPLQLRLVHSSSHSLLAVYLAILSEPVSKRQQAADQITGDLRFFFRSSNHWFNFPHFLSIYFDPERRPRMQPSLLPAAFSIATFFQPSKADFGKQRRRKAMRLRDVAQGALEASFNARWIDEEPAQQLG